ncbi:MAG: cytochrome C [Pseudomonadota bacterium]
MKRQRILGMLLISLALVSACDYGAKSSAGFRLPDGDPKVGEAVFARLECTNCHTVKDSSFDKSPEGEINVQLGGRVHRVQTYGDLVTSIINPSHRLAQKYPKNAVSEDGESLMRNYNSVMTIQELVDLVAFLQGTYKVVPPPGRYQPYAYR